MADALDVGLVEALTAVVALAEVVAVADAEPVPDADSDAPGVAEVLAEGTVDEGMVDEGAGVFDGTAEVVWSSLPDPPNRADSSHHSSASAATASAMTAARRFQ